MESNVKDAVNQVIEVVSTWGLSVLGAIVILIVGFMVAGWASRATSGALARTKRIDDTLRQFLASVVRYGIIVFTVLAVLERFGVQTTSFIAVLGAAGLAIGLAFQGTLSSIAAGVMLLLFRPFRVGQFIEGAGVAGTVEEISLFTTSINTVDNVHIVVPNAQLWNTAIKNHSHNANRRIDIGVDLAAGSDVGKAIAVLHGLLDGDGSVLKNPPASMAVTRKSDGACNIRITAWCAGGDINALVTADIARKIKDAAAVGDISLA